MSILLKCTCNMYMQSFLLSFGNIPISDKYRSDSEINQHDWLSSCTFCCVLQVLSHSLNETGIAFRTETNRNETSELNGENLL